jgi:hypothetical protein
MRTRSAFSLLPLLVVAVACVPIAAAAQQPAADPALPPEFVDGVLDFLNAPTTTRLNGRSRVAVGQRLVGQVGILGGDLVVVGTIEGDVVLVNGNLTVEEEGRITGDVLIVGGRVISVPDGSVGGEIQVMPDRLRLVARGDEVILTPASSASRRGLYLGGARITVRSGTNYNRVEGLPVLFGPIFHTSSRNPLRVEALGIWRTEHDQTRDDLGFRFLVEQTFGPPTARLGLGAGVFSQVEPVESWQLGNLEASMSTFLFHLDYRDYFEERGWNVFARAQVPGTTAEVSLEYRHRDITTLPTGSPWTLRRNDRPWRAQPLMPEGELETLTARVVWDERNDPDDATDGWYFDGRITRGLNGSLLQPSAVDESLLPLAAPDEVDSGFTTGLVEFRRHARLSPDQDLALRVVGGGSLDGNLPPTPFQRALGGEGSLPGYRPFALDCGARSEVLPYVHRGTGESEPAFARYGCARVVLFQLQYRSRLNVDLTGGGNDAGFNEGRGLLDGIDLDPSWLLFFNAGRGWSQRGDLPDEPAVADIGAGVTLGGLGAYLAYPLSRDDRRLNFFLRLQHRF